MKLIILCSCILSFYSYSVSVSLEQHYSQNVQNSLEIKELQKRTMSEGTKAVPALVKVLKNKKYPEKTRWIAMMMLGKIMGKKSISYLAKFSNHSEWFMRLASLKALLALNAKSHGRLFAKMLKDKSLLVRYQALENIEKMNLKAHASSVWEMLFDETNYSGKSGKRRRTDIIRAAIKVVGKLGYKPAVKPLLKMMQDKRYLDVYKEVDFSLSQITGRNSPVGSYQIKSKFWK